MTGVINPRSGIRPSHPLDVNQNRLAAAPQEETQTVGSEQDRSALPSPNRTAHERLKSQQLQRVLNENSDVNSTPLAAISSQCDQATKNNEQRLPRDELQLNLTKIRKHFETLKAKNWSPDEREFYCDMALLPIAIKAENAREPGLNLHHFDSFHSFASALKSGNLQNGRAIFPLLGKEVHAVAADIRTFDGKVSILILEPLKINTVRHMYVESRISAMSKVLPENAKLAVLSVDAQKAVNGCRIFALSAASKLAKESKFFDEIHKANSLDQVQALKNINKFEIESRLSNAQPGDDPVDVYASDQYSNFRILNAHRSVPAPFQKHTQAMSSLKAWADEDKLAQTVVNEQGETFLSRFERHARNRFQRDFLHDEKDNIQWRGVKQFMFSTSIEEKRLTYLNRAVAYLDIAPQEEISDFLRHFYETQKKHKLPDQLHIVDAYNIGKSEVGPRKKLNRPRLDL